MSVWQLDHVKMAPRVLTPSVDISVVVPVDSKENIAIKVTWDLGETHTPLPDHSPTRPYKGGEPPLLSFSCYQ